MAKVYTGICPLRIEVEASEMEEIAGVLLDDLECGDIIVKHTKEDGKDLYHAYIVTHKQATGICFSYNTTGYSETLSYDKVDGVWTFNSKDVWQAE